MGITKKMKLSLLTSALIGVEARSPPSEDMLALFNVELTSEDCESQMCPRHYNPVCASNGVTFGNECTFRVAKCDQPDLVAVNLGPCSATTTPAPKKCEWKMCSREYRPVCGNNGVTYPTACILENEQCDNEGLEVAYTGECKKNCSMACSREYRPTCGSDGNVHSNLCMFEYASCMAPFPLEIMPSEFCSGKANLIEKVNLKSAKKNKSKKSKKKSKKSKKTENKKTVKFD